VAWRLWTAQSVSAACVNSELHDEMLYKSVSGAIFKLYCGNLCEMFGKTSKFQDTSSYGRHLRLAAAVVKGNWDCCWQGLRAQRDDVRVWTVDWARAGTSGNRVHRQQGCYRFCILPTQCICVSCVDLRTNCDYFPIQH